MDTGRIDSLLTSFALLLKKTDVERSEMRVINRRVTGNSILRFPMRVQDWYVNMVVTHPSTEVASSP